MLQPQQTYAFAVADVRKSYPHFSMPSLTLSLETGKIMGLVGVNGAGKTTLLRILMGLIVPDQGHVEVLGCALPMAQVQAKKDIGFASEDMRLYPSQTLRWHMEWIASIFPNWDESYAKQLLVRFDLRADQLMRGMSHGQRVKAMLLLCLARRPKLLLLDEPTTGLDPIARSEVMETLAEVLRDESRSVLFSSHNTHDVEQLADVISFLHQGTLLASLDKDRFLGTWRRVLARISSPISAELKANWVSCKQNGSIAELKTDCFDESMLSQLRAIGAEIQSVESMNLEDIFVTTVRKGARQ